MFLVAEAMVALLSFPCFGTTRIRPIGGTQRINSCLDENGVCPLLDRGPYICKHMNIYIYISTILQDKKGITVARYSIYISRTLAYVCDYSLKCVYKWSSYYTKTDIFLCVVNKSIITSAVIQLYVLLSLLYYT